MTPRTPLLLLALCLSASFSLAAWLHPRAQAWRGPRAQADTLLKVLLGDGRRMFANHFFTKADVYLHSGYYPSLFDQAQLQCESPHARHEHHEHDEQCGHDPESPDEDHDAEHAHEHEHEHGDELFSKPRDWLERFRWRFRITEHTHLDKGNEREVLPWLKLATELDPQQVDTYTVAAYWLRNRLGKAAEAEAFLREGLRANPNSHEILFELGCVYSDYRHDTDRARHLWERALQLWDQNEGGQPTPNLATLRPILIHLARAEEAAGNREKAIFYLQRLRGISPKPDAIEKQIEALRAPATTP